MVDPETGILIDALPYIDMHYNDEAVSDQVDALITEGASAAPALHYAAHTLCGTQKCSLQPSPPMIFWTSSKSLITTASSR